MSSVGSNESASDSDSEESIKVDPYENALDENAEKLLTSSIEDALTELREERDLAVIEELRVACKASDTEIVKVALQEAEIHKLEHHKKAVEAVSHHNIYFASRH